MPAHLMNTEFTLTRRRVGSAPQGTAALPGRSVPHGLVPCGSSTAQDTGHAFKGGRSGRRGGG